MDIQHIHLHETSSTQTVLKDHLRNNHASSHTLISTDKQTNGVGRRGHDWTHFENALAFSFTLAPSQTLTLTPLEIGLHIADFFSPQVLLKWPNDLLNDRKEKAGGIICQLLDGLILVGIGINLRNPPTEEGDFPYPIGGIFTKEENLSEFVKKELPLKIYESILEKRLSDFDIIEKWSKYCCHFKSKVTITDGQTSYTGDFLGITQNGEAKLLLDNGKEQNVLTGSLRF